MTDIIYSQDFTLAEWKDYHAPTGDWEPLESEGFRALHYKWVYVFREVGSSRELFMELYAGRQTDPEAAFRPEALDFRMTPWGPVLRRERDRRPSPIPCGHILRFPHRIDGALARYFFFVSRIRLPLATLERLLGRFTELLKPVVLDRENMGTSCRRVDGVWVLGVTDPISVGFALNRRVNRSRNSLLNYTGHAQGQSDETRRSVQERQSKKFVAEVLTELLRLDRGDQQDLLNEFSPNGRERMRVFLIQYNRTVRVHVVAAERTGMALARLLGGDLMRIVAESYTIFREQDFRRWVDWYPLMIRRISETVAGREYMASVFRDEGHWINRYLFADSPLPIGELLESAGALLGALEAAVPFIERVRLERWTRALNRVSPRANARVVASEDTIQVLGNQSVQIRRVDVDENSLGNLAQSLGAVVELANLFLAIQSVEGKIRQDRASEIGAIEIFDVLGSLAGTTGAIGSALGVLPSRAVGFLGAASAIVDVIVAGDQARERGSYNDRNAEAAYVGVAVSSAVLALASFSIFLGLSASSSVVGIPLGAIMVGAGVASAALWFIAGLLTDSDLELFVAHSFWGRAYGEGADAPEWAGGPFRSWRGNPARQQNALLNLLYSLELEMGRGARSCRREVGRAGAVEEVPVGMWCRVSRAFEGMELRIEADGRGVVARWEGRQAPRPSVIEDSTRYGFRFHDDLTGIAAPQPAADGSHSGWGEFYCDSRFRARITLPGGRRFPSSGDWIELSPSSERSIEASHRERMDWVVQRILARR